MERVLVDSSSKERSRSTSSALCDGADHVAAVMEHVEEAQGVPGTSCVLPAPSLDAATRETIEEIVCRLALALGVVGLVNVQLAVVEGDVFVIEAVRVRRGRSRSRAATEADLVEAACRLAAGARLSDLDGPASGSDPHQFSVKAAVLPFARFPAPTPCSARRCARRAR